MCVRSSERLMLCVSFLYHFFPSLFEMHPSLDLEGPPVDRVVSELQISSCLYSPEQWDWTVYPHTGTYMDAGNLNSRPCA